MTRPANAGRPPADIERAAVLHHIHSLALTIGPRHEARTIDTRITRETRREKRQWPSTPKKPSVPSVSVLGALALSDDPADQREAREKIRQAVLASRGQRTEAARLLRVSVPSYHRLVVALGMADEVSRLSQAWRVPSGARNVHMYCDRCDADCGAVSVGFLYRVDCLDCGRQKGYLREPDHAFAARRSVPR